MSMFYWCFENAAKAFVLLLFSDVFKTLLYDRLFVAF